MSNYWDLYCCTCDVKADAFHWNHGEVELRQLAEALPLVPQLSKLLLVADLQLNCSAERHSLSHLIAFATDHANHDIRPRSEYDYTDDQCPELVNCKECGHRSYCALLKGHDGDHAPSKAKK
jgi:hypothetical protein